MDGRLAGDKHRSYQSVVKLNKRRESLRGAVGVGATRGGGRREGGLV